MNWAVDMAFGLALGDFAIFWFVLGRQYECGGSMKSKYKKRGNITTK